MKSPYSCMSSARQLENAENMRGAETEWKNAVHSADSLPLDEYRKVMEAELHGYQNDAGYEAQPGVKESSFRNAFSEVLSLPFITRVELASFYARHGAYSEALESCHEAFATLPDSFCFEDPRVSELYHRATLMRQTLLETVGPDEMERLFEENFAQLDADGNGFVHHAELERAQFDLNLSPQCQFLIKHLLSHYFDVEAAHNDEWGVDIKGISLRDMKAYAARRNADWKRLSKSGESTKKEYKKWW